jgi:hypothetical protein
MAFLGLMGKCVLEPDHKTYRMSNVEQGMTNIEGNDIINDHPATIDAFIKEYRTKFFCEKRISSMREAFRLDNRG